jgi:transcriptional regulator with XRE-family HTH domain
MYLRSQRTPAEVGLPHLARRRVPGLRRSEVAELAGVSEDWYRWFESGRPISVSPKFLARLADVLELSPQDRLTLYRLAIPELFRSYDQVTLQSPAQVQSNVTPILLPSEIEGAQRRFDAAREAFLTAKSANISDLRPRIVGSWKRSQSLKVRAEMLQAPLALPTDDRLADAREANRALLDAALPILIPLESAISEMGYCVALADRLSRILYISGDRDARRLVERSGIVAGTDLSETAVGANGVGTVIADGRPLQITASEHFVEGGRPLTCTGAPIRDAKGGVCGALVLMGSYRLVRPTLVPAVVRSALEVEEELAKRHDVY